MTARAMSLRACCERLEISYRTGKRRIAAGTFPIPSLPRRARGEHLKFSTAEVDRYFEEASVADARVVSRRSPRAHPPALRLVGGRV